MTDEKDMLIDFSSIEKNLEHTHQRNRGVEAIPIDKIVGSIDRYEDFTEEFLPHRERVSTKYEIVKEAMLAGRILPPVKVYQIFDSYFVIDGHHRVTVAKNELKATAIDADVTEIHFDLELNTKKKYNYDTDQAKMFLIRLEEDAFERKTFLANRILLHPLKVTDLTSYAKLYEEIIDFKKVYNNGEFAKKALIYSSYLWYEKRFLPAIEIVLEEGILNNFPRRTYTDLYLWIQQHKYYLSQAAGHDVGFDFTKDDFIEKFSRTRIFDLIPPLFKDIVKGLAFRKR